MGLQKRAQETPITGESSWNPNPHIQGENMNKHMAEACRFSWFLFRSNFGHICQIVVHIFALYVGVEGTSIFQNDARALLHGSQDARMHVS